MTPWGCSFKELHGTSPWSEEEQQHGLAYRSWKQATPAHIQRILGHSRVSTTLKYGKPTEE